jgi:hypothetical protein
VIITFTRRGLLHEVKLQQPKTKLEAYSEAKQARNVPSIKDSEATLLKQIKVVHLKVLISSRNGDKNTLPGASINSN